MVPRAPLELEWTLPETWRGEMIGDSVRRAATGVDGDGQLWFWSVEGRLAEVSAQGDLLETLAATVDFEMFRPTLPKALGEKPRSNAHRPFDPRVIS